ncbi:MAG: hypothetical protein OQK82_01660 [Candidatus Pacearchaeota archaeon]|nr:hypothetical protein [Candidatus Pacearchaeota archaeon]
MSDYLILSRDSETQNSINHSKKFIFFIPIIILFLIVTAVFLFVNASPSEDIKNFQLKLQGSVSKEFFNKTIDCGKSFLSSNVDDTDSFDCLIEVAESCGYAKMYTSNEVNFLGIIVSSTEYIELKGEENEKCIFYQRMEDNGNKLSFDTKELMLRKGISQEEINKKEEEFNDAALETIGMFYTCKFDREELVLMLKRWKQGIFNGGVHCDFIDENYICEFTGDFENAECVGYN